MRECSKLVAITALLALGACNSGRHSSAGFRLPPDGDIERGKAAFVALGCPACHEVSGVDLPRPTGQPPLPVFLGGEVTNEITDGYLVTSVIYPSYGDGHYRKEHIVSGGITHMPNYADKMTVRQLTDITAFLQSRYRVELPSRYTYY